MGGDNRRIEEAGGEAWSRPLRHDGSQLEAELIGLQSHKASQMCLWLVGEEATVLPRPHPSVRPPGRAASATRGESYIRALT